MSESKSTAEKQSIAQKTAIEQLFAAQRKIETAEQMLEQADDANTRNASKARDRFDRIRREIDDLRYYIEPPDDDE